MTLRSMLVDWRQLRSGRNGLADHVVYTNDDAPTNTVTTFSVAANAT